MTAVERILKLAAGEVGVTERPAGSNKVKYNTWFYGREVSGSSYPWCCAFICWLFYTAGTPALIRKTGGCTTLMNWFKARGRLVSAKEAKPGDLVFFQFDKDAYADHIGIVEKVNKNGVVTIEGNTSVTSNDNGGAVMRRTRRWSVIMAVARPDWERVDRENGKEEEVKMTNEEVKKLIAEEVQKQIAPLMPKVFRKVEEVPSYWREEIAALKEAGVLKGDGKSELNLTESEVKALAAVARLYKGGESA